MFVWILAVVLGYVLCLTTYHVMYRHYLNRIFNGESTRYKLMEYRTVLKISSVIAILLIVFIVGYFLLIKHKVYKIPVDDISTYNYGELIEVINREFEPDEGKIYMLDCCVLIGSDFWDLLNHQSFTAQGLRIIRKDKVYSLYIQYRDGAIVIEEGDANIQEQKDKTIVELVRELPLANDIFTAYGKVEIQHVKENITVKEEEYVNIRYDRIGPIPYNQINKSTEQHKKFIIDQTGLILEVIEDTTIVSEDYFYFRVINFASGATGTIYIDYYVEK